MVGRTLGHYRVLDKLGEGGMGEVYLANDSVLGRDVAIKVLPEAFTKDPERLARFEREAKVLAALNHPHIAQVYAFEGDLTESPTLTYAPTGVGVILGTAAYMSPEQVRGQEVDKRSNIWAFGVVLWEMLTGKKLFQGDTVSDVLASTLMREPDWEGLPPALPTAVTRVLRRCLVLDPKGRLHDIADARIELEEAFEEPNVPARTIVALRPLRLLG